MDIEELRKLNDKLKEMENVLNEKICYKIIKNDMNKLVIKQKLNTVNVDIYEKNNIKYKINKNILEVNICNKGFLWSFDVIIEGLRLTLNNIIDDISKGKTNIDNTSISNAIDECNNSIQFIQKNNDINAYEYYYIGNNANENVKCYTIDEVYKEVTEYNY